MTAAKILVFLSILIYIQTADFRIVKSQSYSLPENWSIYNIVNVRITGTATVRPYQYIDYNQKGPQRIGFDFQGPSATNRYQSSPLIRISESDTRVDIIEDHKVNILFSYLKEILASYSKYYSLIYFSYFSLDKKSSITVELHPWAVAYTNCFSKQEPILLGDKTFYYKNQSDAAGQNYAFYACSDEAEVNTTVDLTILNHFLIHKGVLKGYDRRANISNWFLFEGVGQIYFNFSKYKTYVNTYLSEQKVVFKAYSMYQQIFYKQLKTEEYSNMSVKVGSTDISGVTQDYFFKQVYLSRPNSQVTAIIGYHNITSMMDWVTPIREYSLPIFVVKNLSIQVYLLYHQNQTTPSNKSFFISVNLRKDFDTTTKTFSNSSFLPQSKVVVCYDCSDYYNVSDDEADILDQNNIPIKVIYRRASYKLRKGKDSDIDVYIFYAESKQGCPVNFDIYAFVRYIRDKLLGFANQSVVCVQAGVKLYNGQGLIYFNDVKFKVSSITGLTYDIAQDVYSWPEKGCLIGMGYNRLDACLLQEVDTDLISNWFMNARGFGFFLRLTAMTSLIDEFVYYNYHNQSYDAGITTISKICRNFTSVKYLAPNLLSGVQTDYPFQIPDIGPFVGASSTSGIDLPRIPQNRYGQRVQWPQFFTNTYDFWILTMPLTFLVFTILFGFSILAQICLPDPRARVILRILRPYRSLMYFWSVLIADNMTYLSFKCFLNIKKFVPFLSDGTISYAFFSEVSCILIMFFLVFTVCGICIMAWLFSRKRLGLGTRKTIPGSYLMFTLLMATKFASGFIHAFIQSSNSKIWLLFCLYAGAVLIVLWNYSLISRRFNLICPIILLTTKLILHFFLLLQIHYRNGSLAKVDNENSLWIFFSVISRILFFVMMFTNFVYKFQAWIIFSGSKSRKDKNIKQINKSMHLITLTNQPINQTNEMNNKDIIEFSNNQKFSCKHQQRRQNHAATFKFNKSQKSIKKHPVNIYSLVFEDSKITYQYQIQHNKNKTIDDKFFGRSR